MDDKSYLLLYKYSDENGDDHRSYENLVGRENAFMFIKNMVEYIDLFESKIIASHLTVDGGITAYEFMTYIQNHFNEYITDGFDIDSYV